MTTWSVELEERARKDLHSLGAVERARVLRYLRDRITRNQDPRRFGDVLVGPLAGLWRYRVGDLRIVTRIEEQVLVVLVIRIEHHSTVYR